MNANNTKTKPRSDVEGKKAYENRQHLPSPAAPQPPPDDQTAYFRPKFRPLGSCRPFCALRSVGLIERGGPTPPEDEPPRAERSSPFACPPIPDIPPPSPKLACLCALLRGLSGLSALGPMGTEAVEEAVGLPTAMLIPILSLVVLRRAVGRFSWYSSSKGPAEPLPIRRDFSCLACTARKWLNSSCHLISSRTTLERVEAIVETAGLLSLLLKKGAY